MVSPAFAVTVVAPSKLYNAPPKLRSLVASLPIFVIPITPGSAVSVPGVPPIAPVIVIFPLLSSLESALSPALIFNPPNSLSTPIAPVIVTAPVPDLITNASLFPSSPDWIAPSKVTAPPVVPVSIVCVLSPHRDTPEVPNVISSLLLINDIAVLLPGFTTM